MFDYGMGMNDQKLSAIKMDIAVSFRQKKKKIFSSSSVFCQIAQVNFLSNNFYCIKLAPLESKAIRIEDIFFFLEQRCLTLWNVICPIKIRWECMSEM